MTLNIKAIIPHIEANNLQGLRDQFQQSSELDIIYLGSFVGPDILRSIMYSFARQSSNKVPTLDANSKPLWQMCLPTYADPKVYIPAILSMAFQDHRFLTPESKKILTKVHSALLGIRSRRAASPQVSLNRDITHLLPTSSSCPAPLSEQNFSEVATRQNISIAAIKAVAQVESGGRSGFDDQYRPKILFEAHHFRKYTKNIFDLSHPHLSCNRSAAKKFYGWNQYARLYEAMILEPTAAIKACSWGKFQVLGSNHNGWSDPISFARAMFASESNHLRSFEAFCEKGGLIVHLRNKNWAKFAEGYNGKNYKDFEYDVKIGNAYQSFGGK